MKERNVLQARLNVFYYVPVEYQAVATYWSHHIHRVTSAATLAM